MNRNSLALRRRFISIHFQSTEGMVRANLELWKKNRTNPQKNPQRARPERARKVSVRPQPRGESRRAVAAPRRISPLARLVHALIQKKIRFQVAGMSAAILQGVPLGRIYASKRFVGRPKDLAHLPLLEQTMRLLRRRTGR